MTDNKKVLIVEDELTNSLLLKKILSKGGFLPVVAHNGMDALKHLEKETFAAILTDWMMPQIDGIELIRRVREKIQPLPFIIMITALVSDGAKTYALESGADDYIAKPIDTEELLTRLKDGLEKYYQAPATANYHVKFVEPDSLPNFVAVAIATSTGGPPTLIEIFKTLPNYINASFFIVQHGPPWMLETFTQRLQKDSPLKVMLAGRGMVCETGCVYIAPGDKHLRIEKNTFRILLDDGPKENFVRPAADPLFRSIAESFGKYSVGVILTGLGRDGSQGAAQITSVGGMVIVQDPSTAVAPAMPSSAIATGINCKVAPLKDMAKVISETVFPISATLKMTLAKL
jgi:two-component system chemotaxis response regulator CheB